MSGWIKLYRNIENNSVLNDGEPYNKMLAWIWLLLHANVEDHEIKYQDGQSRTIKRGQLHTSIKNLSRLWNWGEKKTATFLDNLELQQMISTNRDTHGTTITIEKYTLYQATRSTNHVTSGSTNDGTNDGTDDGRYKKKEGMGANLVGSTPMELRDPRYIPLKVGEADVL